MKFAFSQPTDDVETLFREFRRTGYDGLQLKFKQYGAYLDEPQRFLDEYGDLPGVASGLIIGTLLNEESSALLRKVFAFGAAVGTELIVVCHGEPREGLTPDDIRGFARALSQFGKEAAEQGVKLSLHNHFDMPVMYREDFRVFFDAVEDDAVGLTLDTAHAAMSGVDDIAGLIRDMKHVIDNFHMKDIRNNEFKVLGDGEIDFVPIFAAVNEIGYDGWMSVDEESGADVADSLQHCFDFLSRGMRQNEDAK